MHKALTIGEPNLNYSMGYRATFKNRNPPSQKTET